MPLSALLVVPARPLLVPATLSAPALAASPPRDAVPAVEVSPANALVPANESMTVPPLARVGLPWPAAPALALPPPSTMTGGTVLRPPPPTGGGRSASPHAKATQAANTQNDGAWPLNEGVTWSAQATRVPNR